MDNYTLETWPGITVESLILFKDMAHFVAVISQIILTTSLGLYYIIHNDGVLPPTGHLGYIWR